MHTRLFESLATTPDTCSSRIVTAQFSVLPSSSFRTLSNYASRAACTFRFLRQPSRPISFPEERLVQCHAALVCGEERLAVAPGYGFGPHLLDLFDDLGGHRHVIKFLGHLAAIGVSPSEELERCRCRCSVRRLLGNEDEGRRRHRPGCSTRLVGEDDTIARH